jgi:UDP-3-O-[3-hydroxymyristoyl] glucosamine N-acyltransferase
MKKLSDFLDCVRDIEIQYTHYANSTIPKSVWFGVTSEFFSIANKNENIVAIITTSELASEVNKSKGLVVSTNPKKDFFHLHNLLLENGLNNLEISNSIDSTAVIANTVKIHGNVQIGKNVIIEDFVVINSNTIIEDNTYIAQNVIIGARGMHNTMIEGEFLHVKDAGGVLIGKNCEILAGAIIQKSYFSEFTKIGNQTKISVGVKVGHGCIIGERTLVAGSAQLAGYNTIGDDVWIGPSTVLAHGLTIGNGAQIKLGSVVVKDVKENEEVSGNFAYKHTKRVRNFIKEQR